MVLTVEICCGGLKLDDARQFPTRVMCEHVIRSRSKHWPGSRKVGFLLHFALMVVTTAQSCDLLSEGGEGIESFIHCLTRGYFLRCVVKPPGHSQVLDRDREGDRMCSSWVNASYSLWEMKHFFDSL